MLIHDVVIKPQTIFLEINSSFTTKKAFISLRNIKFFLSFSRPHPCLEQNTQENNHHCLCHNEVIDVIKYKLMEEVLSVCWVVKLPSFIRQTHWIYNTMFSHIRKTLHKLSPACITPNQLFFPIIVESGKVVFSDGVGEVGVKVKRKDEQDNEHEDSEFG